MPAMDLRVGTSGYAYKEWCGTFYPEKLPQARMLAAYAERLATVEINNTFYRMPTPDLLARWAGEVPDGFTFALKAPQRITHIGRLKNVEDPVDQFLRCAAALGPKLGPLLFQAPPNFRKDLDRLRAMAPLLPRERRAAFEFRHPSWHDEETFAVLRENGWALVAADTDEDPEPAPIVATADWGYLRLRRVAYDDGAMRQWVERLRTQPWREADVYFKHEDSGTGPRFALALREIWDA